MNCIDFRRQLAAVPDALDAEALAHEATCTRCQQARADARGFEAALRNVLAVPVPESLADRILLHQTTAARGEQRGRGLRTAWRIAAVLVVAVAGGLMWRAQGQTLPKLAVEHIPHEPAALVSHERVPLAEIRTFFAARGVELHDDPGEVDYLTECPLGRDKAVHMVVQTDRGPVTVFFVGGRNEPARVAWQRGGMVGRTVPVAGGTLVMLGGADGQFDAIESRWTQALGTAALAAL